MAVRTDIQHTSLVEERTAPGWRSDVFILVALVAVIGAGYWMSGLGQPFNSGLFTIHKLASLALIAFMAVYTIRVSRITALNMDSIAGITATGLLLLGTMVTGGALSIVSEAPAWLLKTHQVLPLLTVFSAGLTVLLLKANLLDQ